MEDVKKIGLLLEEKIGLKLVSSLLWKIILGTGK
jgi:hypothetical protein